jgi:hypothetical protein
MPDAAPYTQPDTAHAATTTRASTRASWAERLSTAGALRMGIALAAALNLAFVLAQLALDRVPFGPHGSMRDFRVGLLHCVLAVYLPMACARVLHAAAVAARSIRTRAGMASGARLATLPPAVPAVAALTGLAGALMGPYLMEPGVATPLYWWNPAHWNGASVWHRVLGLWVSPWSVMFALVVPLASVRLSRLARDVELRDVFDRAPLAPFVQPALTNALLAVGLLSLWSAFSVDFGAARPVLVNAAVALALVAVALLLPVQGVRRRVHEAKEVELAWAREAIARERRLLRDAAGPARPDGMPADAVSGGRLADLLAYRSLVEQVSELPFDNPALRRVALYLLIPVGSWAASTLGQHLAERYVLK